MLIPSKRLRQFIESYSDRDILCNKLDIDETTLSRLLTKDRGASIRMVEKVARFTGWPMGDAWEIIDGETEE